MKNSRMSKQTNKYSNTALKHTAKIYDSLPFHGREFMWTPERGRRPCKTEMASYQTKLDKNHSTNERRNNIAKAKRIKAKFHNSLSTIVTGPYEWKISMRLINQSINKSFSYQSKRIWVVMNYHSFRTCFSSTDWLFEYVQKKNFIKREFLLYCKISNFIQSRTVPHMLHEIVYIACQTQYMVSKYEIRTKNVKLSGLSHFVPRCTLKYTLSIISLVRI